MKRCRFVGVLSVLLIFSALFLFASCGFSYEKSKLGKYVDLSREDYYGLTVSIPAAKTVEESDVDLEIKTFRLHLRELVSEGEVTRHAAWGDNVNLYYHITVVNEPGSFLPMDGFSNMTEGEPGPVVIGGGVLPEVFENGLTGHAAIETLFAPKTDPTETVAESDVVYLDLTYRYTDGETERQATTYGARIDLSANAAAASAFAGLHPGDEFDLGYNEGDPIVSDWDGDGENETLAAVGTLRSLSRGEMLGRIEGDVPADYYDAAIAGKHVVLLYAIASVDQYSVPEITEELLKENVPEFTLSEGGDLDEEFRDYVYRLLVNESRREWQATIEEKLWERLNALDCVKKYPAAALRDEIKEQKRQLERLYEYYGAALEEQYGTNPYETVEAFGYAYYDLEGSEYADVYDYLKKEVAPNTVKQKLIIYYIADAEGWRATSEEYETELPKQLTYYAESEGITTAEALNKYGEEFFRQAIQYNKVMTNLVDATVIE